MLAVYFATLEKVMISSIFPLPLRAGLIEPYGFSGIALKAAYFESAASKEYALERPPNRSAAAIRCTPLMWQ
jgi:hypothetical protein